MFSAQFHPLSSSFNWFSHALSAYICLSKAVYCAVMGPRLLRGREEPPAVSTEAHFQVAFRLSEPSPLLGASLDDLGLHRFRGVHWLRLRSEELGPPEQRLQATDLIEVSCTCEAVVQLRHVRRSKRWGTEENQCKSSKNVRFDMI